LNPAFKVGVEKLPAMRAQVAKWGRCGLLCNQASVDQKLRPSWRIIKDLIGDNLTTLFGPQHGFESTVQDNMIESGHKRHKPTGCTVYSLYSETREPTPAMLADLDTIIVDLQIVGCRVYTYKYSLAGCLRAAKKLGKRVVVLDRPNPLGGCRVEGTSLDLEVRSFVGEFEIPMRHGLTAGEAALLFNAKIGAELEVIALDGWVASKYWDELEREWVITSPNIPTFASAAVYPGTVIFEGTSISEGRGTTLPFQLIGSPYFDAHEYCARTTEIYGGSLAGVILRPASFQPTFHKFAGQECSGVNIHVLDAGGFASFHLGMALLRASIELAGPKFGWKAPPYEYEYNKDPIDLILGIPNVKSLLTASKFSLKDPIWSKGVDSYIERVKPYLLYERQMFNSVPE